MKHLKMNAVFWQTARRRLTDLRLALRPGTVSPAEARLHQARLPLLHLGRTWPPVTLGSLDHCPPPQELACRKADKKGKKKNELFIHEDVDWNAEIWPVHSFDLVMIRKTVQFRAAGGMWMWIRICLSRSDLGLFNHLSYSRSSNESWRSNDGQHK